MRSRNTSVIIGILWLSLAGLVSLNSSEALAQSNQYKRPKKVSAGKKTGKKGGAPQKETKKSSDKLDISDLENKYWAPKDTDFSVVQNRTYSKKGRYSASLTAGILVNDSYSTGLNTGLAFNYFFNERMGVELSYVSTNSKNNKMADAFQADSGALPNHGKVKSFVGAGFSWVPFYAKMSILGKKIIYFDMAVTPGLGVTQYEQQVDAVGGGNKGASAVSLTLDVTQYFFFSNNFALRADLKNRWFNEDVLGYASLDRGIKIKTNENNTTQFMFGFTYFH